MEVKGFVSFIPAYDKNLPRSQTRRIDLQSEEVRWTNVAT